MTSQNSKIKIAIIEDDAAVSQMYHTKFEKAGFEVGLAADGVAALSLLDQLKPDVILLDLMMPNMSGLDLMTALHKWPSSRTKRPKIIVFTNLSDQNTLDRAKTLGADGFLVKAELTPEQVVEEVKEILKK